MLQSLMCAHHLGRFNSQYGDFFYMSMRILCYWHELCRALSPDSAFHVVYWYEVNILQMKTLSYCSIRMLNKNVGSWAFCVYCSRFVIVCGDVVHNYSSTLRCLMRHTGTCTMLCHSELPLILQLDRCEGWSVYVYPNKVLNW